MFKTDEEYVTWLKQEFAMQESLYNLTVQEMTQKQKDLASLSKTNDTAFLKMMETKAQLGRFLSRRPLKD